ncbi:hypothetical protein GOBAR_DD29494 [Gossypium barbadense]|nr:hypothetical protein GOBAR_DD29494 [Gossypium barbadense]
MLRVFGSQVLNSKVNEWYVNSDDQETNARAACFAFSLHNDHGLLNVNEVHDEWFSDEERVRKSVGLFERPVVDVSDASKFTCGICFDLLPCDNFASASCGHPFCRECWQGYICTSINDGPGCLLLRCPEPSCKAAVGPDMIDKLAPCEEKEKYSQFLLRSYIEDNREAKWCPAPGCENAVNFAVGGGDFDVTCLCSYRFCWNCTVEAHRPVDCETVTKWMLKNSVDGENVNWILHNSKTCPKCKRPIEKNQGCMHMTCTPPCSYEFCWLCLRAWSSHGVATGGFYSCNVYEAEMQKGNVDAEMRREMAKNSFEKYTHYYERWASNQSSREKALEDLNRMENGKALQCAMHNNVSAKVYNRSMASACNKIVSPRSPASPRSPTGRNGKGRGSRGKESPRAGGSPKNVDDTSNLPYSCAPPF